MTKQITIYDLLPLLKDGWVAMDDDGRWYWFDKKPNVHEPFNIWVCDGCKAFYEIAPKEDSDCFKQLSRFAGRWQDSLINVADYKKDHNADAGKTIDIDLYAKLCNALTQLDEANEVIKKAAELCPDKNLILLSYPPKESQGMKTYNLLNNYLIKYGVKE